MSSQSNVIVGLYPWFDSAGQQQAVARRPAWRLVSGRCFLYSPLNPSENNVSITLIPVSHVSEPAQKAGSVAVVTTHMPPMLDKVAPRFKSDALNVYFVNNHENLVEDAAALYGVSATNNKAFRFALLLKFLPISAIRSHSNLFPYTYSTTSQPRLMILDGFAIPFTMLRNFSCRKKIARGINFFLHTKTFACSLKVS